MNKLTQKAVATKDFVKKHRVAIAVVVTSAVWLKINDGALREHNEFLKAHDLYDKFYTPEDL